MLRATPTVTTPLAAVAVGCFRWFGVQMLHFKKTVNIIVSD